MTVHVPYNQFDLTLANLSAVSKLYDETVQQKISDEFKCITDIQNLNEEVAKYHGISIKDLIDSPNLITLIELYKESMFHKGIAIFEKYGLTNQEAYAIMLSRG